MQERENQIYLRVRDCGTGMSLNVIKDYLFDFGKSYWNSDLMQEEFPGLISKNVLHTGKYGIGFFSIFMLSDNIKITTRKCTDALEDTHVLDFNNGLNNRPIIRAASREECLTLIDGGTIVELLLEPQIYKQLIKESRELPLSLHDLIVSAAPALDITISAKDYINSVDRIIPLDYWKTCDDEEFITYYMSLYQEEFVHFTEKYRGHAINAVRFMYDDNGEIIGRGWLTASAYMSSTPGLVLCNGLSESKLRHMSGFFLGKNLNAARDSCVLVATDEQLGRWSTEQFKIANQSLSKDKLLTMSGCIKIQNAKLRDFPFICCKERSYTIDEFVDLTKGLNQLRISDNFFLRRATDFDSLIIEDDIFFIDIHSYASLYFGSRASALIDIEDRYNNQPLSMVTDCLSEAWGIEREKLKDVANAKESYVKQTIAHNNGIKLDEYCYLFSRF
ncbi:ATP-binding protein [Vibrio mexicanus]|uniref:ATP-binding protein n=1 Tax=Vibrio mexicanus TaxID=1004326 RepID=UPI00063C75FD|nr:ATP-binding protein [Vibrio mexicanus]